MERITLNIIPKGITPICHASQFDIGRRIALDLMDGLQGYTLSDEEITLRVCKPDMNIVTAAVDVTPGKTFVIIETTEQMTAVEGDNACELKITKDGAEIGSLNFKMRVEQDPLKDGIESETEIHNLEAQIEELVANQYDSENVIFDDEPTAGHGIGYTVTSEGIKSSIDDVAAAIPEEIADLDDVATENPTTGEALVWDADNSRWTNGTVSTVGSIDDLNDVDTTGKEEGDNLRYNATDGEWQAKKNTYEMTLAEYEALAGDYSDYKNSNIILTDAPNLNATAEDISYDGSAVTVKDKIDVSDVSAAITLNANFSDTSKYLYKSANVCSLEIRGKLTATSATTIATFNNSAYYPKCSRVVTAYLDTDNPSATPNGAVWLYDNGNIVYFGNSVSSKNVIISVTYICKG